MPVLTTDGVRLDCRLVPADPRRLVIVAHPAVVGSRYHQVVDLADELLLDFSVMLFDFRGHGRSGGRCKAGFSGACTDIQAVIGRARRLGFEKVAVAGFSLGAAAAFLAAVDGSRIDALVSIGCPPVFPDIAPLRDRPTLSRLLLRALGMRFDPAPDMGPSPLDVAGTVGDFPKLLIFGEWEVASPEDIATFIEAVVPPVEVRTIRGVWHADLSGSESEVRDWLEQVL